MKRDRFPPLPPQDEEEDRRRMGAVVWVIVAGPVCWAAVFFGLIWLWGM